MNTETLALSNDAIRLLLEECVNKLHNSAATHCVREAFLAHRSGHMRARVKPRCSGNAVPSIIANLFNI